MEDRNRIACAEIVNLETVKLGNRIVIARNMRRVLTDIGVVDDYSETPGYRSRKPVEIHIVDEFLFHPVVIDGVTIVIDFTRTPHIVRMKELFDITVKPVFQCDALMFIRQ